MSGKSPSSAKEPQATDHEDAAVVVSATGKASITKQVMRKDLRKRKQQRQVEKRDGAGDGNQPANRRGLPNTDPFVVAGKHQPLQGKPTFSSLKMNGPLSPPPEPIKRRKSEIRRGEPELKTKENKSFGEDEAPTAVANSEENERQKVQQVVEQEPEIDHGLNERAMSPNSSVIEVQADAGEGVKGLGIFSGITSWVSRLFGYWNGRNNPPKSEEAAGNITPDNKPQFKNNSREPSPLKSILKSPSISFQVFPSDVSASDSEFQDEDSMEDESSDGYDSPVPGRQMAFKSSVPRFIGSHYRLKKFQRSSHTQTSTVDDVFQEASEMSEVLRRHMLSVHAISSRRKSKEYVSRNSMEPMKYTCPLCPKSFFNIKDSKKHILKCHKLGTQSQFCDVCGLGFIQENVHEKRTRLHVDEVQTNNPVSDGVQSPILDMFEASGLAQDESDDYDLAAREQNELLQAEYGTNKAGKKDVHVFGNTIQIDVKLHKALTKERLKSDMGTAHQFKIDHGSKDSNSSASQLINSSSRVRIPNPNPPNIPKAKNMSDDAAAGKAKAGRWEFESLLTKPLAKPSRQSLSRSCKRTFP